MVEEMFQSGAELHLGLPFAILKKTGGLKLFFVQNALYWRII